MTLTSGFFNSTGGDRAYTALQISEIFDGIVLDGVLSSIANKLIVTAAGGNMNVNVGSGRAWFNQTWTKNDNNYPLTIDPAEALLKRIDVVYLKIDHNSGVRLNSFAIQKGTPATTPIVPVLTSAYPVFRYSLAQVYVFNGVTVLTQANITNTVGTIQTPFATSLLQQASVSELLVQWEAQFTEWFDAIQGSLSGDPATALQAQIYEIVGDLNPPPYLTNLLALSSHNHSGALNGVQIPTTGLSGLAVTTPKINNLAVTEPKLGPASVTNSKLGLLSVAGHNLAASVAGNGLGMEVAPGGLYVKVDGVTIEISNDTLKIKDNGIGNTQLANRMHYHFITATDLYKSGTTTVRADGGSGLIWGHAISLDSVNDFLSGSFQVTNLVEGYEIQIALHWYQIAGWGIWRSKIAYHQPTGIVTIPYVGVVGSVLETTIYGSPYAGAMLRTPLSGLTLTNGVTSFTLNRDTNHVDDNGVEIGIIGIELGYMSHG